MQTYNVSETYRNLFGTKSSGIRSEFYGDEFPLTCGIIGPAKSGKTSLLGSLCFDQNSPFHMKFQSVHAWTNSDVFKYITKDSQGYPETMNYDCHIKTIKSKQRTLVFDDIPYKNNTIRDTIDKCAQINRHDGAQSNLIVCLHSLDVLNNDKNFPMFRAGMTGLFLSTKAANDCESHVNKLGKILNKSNSTMKNIVQQMKVRQLEHPSENAFMFVSKQPGVEPKMITVGGTDKNNKEDLEDKESPDSLVEMMRKRKMYDEALNAPSGKTARQSDNAEEDEQDNEEEEEEEGQHESD